MTDYIIRTFIKDYYNVKDSGVRQTYGTVSSIVGIAVNVLLSLSKIVVGTIFNSISVMADGVEQPVRCRLKCNFTHWI